jgi:DNA-directed RNA polymerase subunit beta'
LGRKVVAKIVDPATKKVIVEAGDFIQEEALAEIMKSTVEEISVRSALTCEARIGLCSNCYGLDLITRKSVAIGVPVGVVAAQSIGEPGTQLTMRTFHSGGVVGADITQGLPRVEELFEVRKPKKAALISTLAGKIDIVREEDSYRIVVKPSSKLEEIQSFVIDKGEELLAKDGDVVEVGTQLTAGPINLQDLYAIAGASKAQNYILDQIQKVYGAQGVDINDKHVEIIVRQMFNRVKITKSHGSDLLPGDVISRYRLSRANQLAKKAKEKSYEFDTVLVGISKASRMAESWLDAASFEETAAVLTESAIAGAIDELIGLKENVIIGRQIPVGERARLENIVKNQN